MNDTKLIGRISVVTDSEVPYSNIGDVEAGLNEMELRQHIEKHGPAGLYEAISYLSFQVFEAVRELNAKKEKDVEAKIKFLTEPILPVKVQHDKRIKTDGRLSPISLLEDPFDRTEYLAKKDNQQEAKRPALEEAVATNNAERIVGLLQKGDVFRVMKTFVANGTKTFESQTVLFIYSYTPEFVDVSCQLGDISFGQRFSKDVFIKLITSGTIEQMTVAPPNF